MLQDFLQRIKYNWPVLAVAIFAGIIINITTYAIMPCKIQKVPRPTAVGKIIKNEKSADEKLKQKKHPGIISAECFRLVDKNGLIRSEWGLEKLDRYTYKIPYLELRAKLDKTKARLTWDGLGFYNGEFLMSYFRNSKSETAVGALGEFYTDKYGEKVRNFYRPVWKR